MLAKYGITPVPWNCGVRELPCEFLERDMADACVHVMEQVDFSQLQGRGRKCGTATSISAPGKKSPSDWPA
ncbi:MAG: hypothetical protein ACLSUW_00970 [Akkermansia sp.]